MNYSQKQNFCLNKALYGLAAYSEKERRKLGQFQKKKIILLHTKTKRALNCYKQQIINDKTNKVFEIFFNSKLCKNLVDQFNLTDEKFIMHCKLSDLGVNKKDLIEFLFKEGILPQNFYEL